MAEIFQESLFLRLAPVGHVLWFMFNICIQYFRSIKGKTQSP
jgi:hypothetical protein